ncbi:MAG: AMP phosphorylase [Candidatus Aenigmarchaeota archaeon]|nr:AMP phosphorylase [Candidatus Aenigmarchaeota archaeon]
MLLRTKILDIEANGEYIVILNQQDIEKIGFSETGRVTIQKGEKKITAIYNISKDLQAGIIAVYRRVAEKLDLKEGDEIEVESAPQPHSVEFIRRKIKGEKLTKEAALAIVRDAVDNKLTKPELAAFVTALTTMGIDLDEASYLTEAMVETGKKMVWPENEIVLDKHSIGGVPGDKTTMIVVPIVASLGYKIPKSSSRAITNVAGTADRVEAIMPVELSLEEAYEVVKKTNGCMVWGGNLDLAPADDIFIKIENPLKIDPLMLASIMAKKKAMGSKYVVIDIPIGKEVKIKSVQDGEDLARKFIELGKKLGMKVNALLTYGEQPIGHAIGPALEARETLEVLTANRIEADLIDKATDLVATVLEMVGVENAKQKALEALKSGKAGKKFREIIEAQGGDPNIKPEDIPVGKYTSVIEAKRDGFVILIRNSELIKIGRMLGAPTYKGSGMIIHKKLGQKVKKNEPLLTLYSDNLNKLEKTLKYIEENEIEPMVIGDKLEMTLKKISYH